MNDLTYPNLCCPECGNKSVRKASAIYKAGAVDSTYVSNSISVRPFSPKSVRVGRRVTTGSRQSKLVQTLSPPERSAFYGIVGVLGAVVSFFSLVSINSIGSFLWFAIVVVVTVGAFRKHSEEDVQYELDYDEYEKTFYCNKCDTTFRKVR